MTKNLEFIGEIGVNHNGDVALAKDLICAIFESGAQVAKLQLFRPEALVINNSRLAKYQIQNGVTSSSQSEMLESLLIRPDDVLELDRFARDVGVELLVTPFDIQSMRFLVNDLNHTRVKFSSGDLTFHRMIFETAREGAQLLLSTGMSTLRETEKALEVARTGYLVAQGVLPENFTPTVENLRKYIDAIESRPFSSFPISLMHCTSTYPAPTDQLNISALRSMSTLGVTLGYSDHSLTDTGATLALAFGARIFEKHVTLSKYMAGPDHAASLEPEEFTSYISNLLQADRAIGTGVKRPQESELDVKEVARRGLYAAERIIAGERISARQIIALRPESGLSADQEFEVVGTIAKKTIEAGDIIEP
jgi:sialic acid synthase SpsE